MKTKSRKIKAFKRKAEIALNKVLIQTYAEGFDFTIFCIGYIGMGYLMARYVFLRHGLEYFTFVLITCPFAHYILKSFKKEEKHKNEKIRRRLSEENERLEEQEKEKG